MEISGSIPELSASKESLASLGDHYYDDKDDNTKSLNSNPDLTKSLDDELNNLSSELQLFVRDLLDETHLQRKIIGILAAKEVQFSRLTQVMGDKIKGVSVTLHFGAAKADALYFVR